MLERDVPQTCSTEDWASELSSLFLCPGRDGIKSSGRIVRHDVKPGGIKEMEKLNLQRFADEAENAQAPDQGKHGGRD